jgi:MoaA/NifB/PqqE/SkfB family radical SAM enzyme
VGHKSRRQSAIEFYQIEFGDNHVVLESLDHSVTWACNLACIMCGPHNSSTWANELALTKTDLLRIGKLFQKNNTFFDCIDPSNLKKIHFNGGEPLLNNDQIGLLEKLEAQGVLGNVFISYNTNASVYPSERVIELWKQARLVKLFFSIDATDQAFDYIRWPATWAEVQENILAMKNKLPGNIMFGFNVTVGAYNIFEIKQVKAWADKNLFCNSEGDPCDFNWQIAKNFDPKWLRADIKRSAVAHLMDDITSLAVYLESYIEHPSSDLWIESLERIDARRGTAWKKQLTVGNYY